MEEDYWKYIFGLIFFYLIGVVSAYVAVTSNEENKEYTIPNSAEDCFKLGGDYYYAHKGKVPSCNVESKEIKIKEK